MMNIDAGRIPDIRELLRDLPASVLLRVLADCPGAGNETNGNPYYYSQFAGKPGHDVVLLHLMWFIIHIIG
jgi:hypothetical protein